MIEYIFQKQYNRFYIHILDYSSSAVKYENLLIWIASRIDAHAIFIHEVYTILFKTQKDYFPVFL